MAKINSSRTRRTPGSGGGAARRASRARNVTPETPAALSPPPRLFIPAEPPKVPRRPPSKGSKRETLADIAKRIPIQVMRAYFNYPLRTAAQAMNISVTTLKRLCRRQGVKRWPHRQICGINRALSDLEAQHSLASGSEAIAVAKQLRELHRRRNVIIELAFESDEESGRMRYGLDNTSTTVVAHKRSGNTGTSRINTNNSVSSSAGRRSAAAVNAASATKPTPGSPDSETSEGKDDDDDDDDDNDNSGLAWWYPTPVDDIDSAAIGGIDATVAAGGGGDGITVFGSPPGRSSSGGIAMSSRRPHSFNPLAEFGPAAEADAGGETGAGSRAGGGSAVGVVDSDDHLLLLSGAGGGRHQSINVIEQQMTDLAAEGDLLFGADEIAADQDDGGSSLDHSAGDDGVVDGVLASGAGGSGHHNNSRSSAWAYHLFGLPFPQGLLNDVQGSSSGVNGGDLSGEASSSGEAATFSSQDYLFSTAGAGASCVSASPWAGASSGWGTWGPSSSVN